MELPSWVQASIDQFEAPATGKVVITLESYQGGITKMEIGAFIRTTAGKLDMDGGPQRGTAPIVTIQPR